LEIGTKTSDALVPMTDGRALVACLQRIALHHRVPATPHSLTTGLPTTLDEFTPALLVRAARRAGLRARLQALDVATIPRAALPALILLEDNQCAVLEAVNEDGTIRLYRPDAGDEPVTSTLEDLALMATGTVLLARPRFKLSKSPLGALGVHKDHWFWSAMAEHKGIYRDVLLASFFVNMLALAMPIFTMNVYDRVVPNAAFETLWMLTVGVLIALLADLGLQIARGYFLDYAARRIDITLSAGILEKTLGMRLEHKPLSVGAYAANLRSFEFLRDFTTSATLTGLIDIPFALVFIAVIAWISPLMMLPIIAGIVLLLAITMVVRPRLERLTETSYAAGAQRNSTLIETLSGLETLKAMGAESVMQRQWEEATRFLASHNLRARNLNLQLSQSSSTIQRIVQLAVIVVGVYLIAAGQLSMGGLIASMMLSTRAVGPFAKLGSLLTQFQNAQVAMKSLNALFATPSEYQEEKAFISRDSFAGSYDFKNVSFKYPHADSDSLTQVSFKLAAGEHIAVLGRVGSGKSTIAKLALGLFQATGGEIRIDGVDLRQLDPREYRGSVGYVPQDVTLFTGTLRENIALARPGITDAQLIRAVERAGIADWVNRHPLGFDMPISERGDSVSGGQRKCISVARALVTEPTILIMDEPTGGTDQSTERLIIENLKSFMTGRTLIVVTHRNALLSLADRILVVDAGKIVADGQRDAVVTALRDGKIGRADV
jgi:ATP-binding cassette subfamily C protein LapB